MYLAKWLSKCHPEFLSCNYYSGSNEQTDTRHRALFDIKLDAYFTIFWWRCNQSWFYRSFYLNNVFKIQFSRHIDNSNATYNYHSIWVHATLLVFENIHTIEIRCIKLSFFSISVICRLFIFSDKNLWSLHLDLATTKHCWVKYQQ